MIQDAHDKGYETTCNIMAISVVKESEIDQALEGARQHARLDGGGGR